MPLRPIAQQAADACTRAVNLLRSPSPADAMEAMVATLREFDARTGEDLGSSDVADLVEARDHSVAYALDFVLFGHRRDMDGWVRAWTEHDARMLADAAKPGQPHRTLGTWAAGRPE